MKAIVYRKYGSPDVLHLEEVAKPIPGAHEILVRICATTVTAGDVRMRKPDPFAARLYNGIFNPRKVNTLGFELAGVVEAIGNGVTRFAPGDEVFAFTGFGFGAYAEYKCVPENGTAKTGLVALKPANLSFEEAAAIPVGGLTALGFLRKANVRSGHKVLIYGASGSVGTYAVQLAKVLGADVTAVCSTPNLELVRSLGADRAIDYTREDFAASGGSYDFVFDAVGKSSRSRSKSVLNKDGIFLSVMGSPEDPTSDNLAYLKDLFETGRLVVVIDRCCALDQIADAHRYVETGHKRGNVVVTVSDASRPPISQG